MVFGAPSCPLAEVAQSNRIRGGPVVRDVPDALTAGENRKLRIGSAPVEQWPTVTDESGAVFITNHPPIPDAACQRERCDDREDDPRCWPTFSLALSQHRMCRHHLFGPGVPKK